MADLEDLDLIAPADSLYSGGVKINLMRARLDGLYTVLSDITAAEANQVENIGTTTISATQFGYLGALDQGLTTTSTVTFGTINAFTLGGKLTAGAVEIEGSAFDINGGTVDGITSLTAAGNLDIGAHGFTANTLTADGLTATRVVFAGTGGLLSASAAMTFVTDTLTVTKIGAFQAVGAIDFNSQNMTNVDIDSGTINGITDLAVADGGTGSSTAGNARTALGVAIGSDVLAYDAGLSNLAGISMAADKFYYTSGDNTHVAGTVTSFARTILDDANAATVLGTLGLSTDLPNLTDVEVTQLEAIGDVTVSYAQWGYLGACGAGGGQLLAALTTGESTQLETINSVTITNTQWGYLGALATHPIGGDGTAGRELRQSHLYITNGTEDDTLKCKLEDRWNGDVITEVDNIAKNTTTDGWTLSSDGKVLTIEASGLTGNALAMQSVIDSNASGTALDQSCYIAANDLVVRLRHNSTGATQDMAALVNTGAILMNILYITDA